MKLLARRFVQGLLILVPIGVTAWVLYFAVTTIDGLLQLDIPGLGLVLTLALVLVVGFIASSVIGRKAFDLLEGVLTRLPVVKLLYTSLRDLLHAFVGERRSVGRPVMIELGGVEGVKLLGFLTCERFDDPRLAGHVAVYLPQSYNFAGNLVIVERARVHPIDADGAQFFAFVMSGGVAEMSAAQTMLDQPVFGDRSSRAPDRSMKAP
jgi:uncharacterized membrane protein